MDDVPLRRLQAILVPGLNPNPDANLFFVRIHTNEVIHIIVRIRIRCGFCTNSYNFLYELYSMTSYKEPLYTNYSTN